MSDISSSDYALGIEEVNSEVIRLLESREYRLGRNILSTKRMIEEADFHGLVSYFGPKIKRKKKSLQTVFKKPAEFVRPDTNICNIESGAVKTIYSCITNQYDSINIPLVVDNNIEYVMHTDLKDAPSPWRAVDISTLDFDRCDGRDINRYCKMHPHVLFDACHYSLYIDGSVRIMSDVDEFFCSAHNARYGLALHKHHARDCIFDEAKACVALGKGNEQAIRQQMERYRSSGMPEHYGLLEATVIAADLSNPYAIEILEDWYNEYISCGSSRDQLALPYVLWLKGIAVEEIGSLGTNVFRNPKLRISWEHARRL